MKRVVVLFAVLFAAALIAAIIVLPPPGVRLPPQVLANLAASGVEHPVTAVLLNFRGYDTLLEMSVLLIALCGMLAAGAGRERAGYDGPGEPVVRALARRAAPLMVLAAVYLLWAGAHRAGGAFPAGAVLAAALVLLNLARLVPAWAGPGRWLRLGFTGGSLLFVALAVVLSGRGSLLQYPRHLAGALILLVESALMISLGLILAGLFLFLSEDAGDAR